MTDKQEAAERVCTCWFNKYGELIYVEDACPAHGRTNDEHRT